jgi:hypothetical protein
MYTITVFPDAQLQTGSANDKRRVAPFATYGELRTLDTFADVVHTASSMTVSLNEYSASEKCKLGQVHRTGSHFIRTSLIGLDIDDNLSMTQAKLKLSELGYRYGLYTSFNHEPGKAEKFRIILELEEPIEDESTYRATWEALHSQFLGIDTSCKDTARLYFHSNPSTREVAIVDGKLVPVVHEASAARAPKKSGPVDTDGWETVTSRAKLPIEARNWLAGLDEYGEPWEPEPGERSNMFYKLVNLCKERGYDREWCSEKLGARLRDDSDYLKKYGGRSGVEEKIEATLDQVFAKKSRHAKPEVFNAEELSDGRLFVNAWMGSRNIRVSPKGLLCRDQQTWTVLQLGDTLKLDYERHCNEFHLSQADLPKDKKKKIKKLASNLLESALREHVRLNRDKARRELVERLRYNGDAEPTELRKFVDGLVGRPDPVVEAVLAHFIWQVKRKAYNLPVDYHLMSIITGPQGNGKSTAIYRRLLAPLADFIATPALSELADKRHFEAYQYNYVVFCDEMQNAEKADVDGLKNFISADRQTAREMYSTTIVEFKQNCTPIGCSNKSLATLIYDPTGMRRFFEIVTDETLRTRGWAIHDTVNFTKLWQQIDENLPGKGYLSPVWEQIQQAQEQLRMQDPIEAFLEESEAALVEGCETTEVKGDDFYRDYRQFCNRNGHKYKQSNWFGVKLKEYGVFKRQVQRNGERHSVYIVNSTYKKLEQI